MPLVLQSSICLLSAPALLGLSRASGSQLRGQTSLPMSRGWAQSVSQDRAYGPPSPPCTMELFVFGLPSSPTRFHLIVTLFSILVWGKSSCHLCPYFSPGLSNIKKKKKDNLFWGGSVEGTGLGDRIWNSYWQVLESYSESGGGGGGAVLVLLGPPRSGYGHPLSSGHSWIHGPQNWGETSSLGPRLPRVGMRAVLTGAQP